MRTSMRKPLWAPPLVAGLLLVTSCAGDREGRESDPDAGPTSTIQEDDRGVDLRADLNHDGRVDLDSSSDESLEDDTARPAAIMLANVDDDGSRCRPAVRDLLAAGYRDEQLDDCSDASDEVINGDADMLDLAQVMLVSRGQEIEISVEPADRVRVFVLGDSEARPLAGDGLVEASDGPVELRIEALDIVRDDTVWDGSVTIRASAGEAQDEVTLQAAPVELTGNLGRIESLFVEGPAPPEREQAIDAAHFPPGEATSADDFAVWRAFAISDEEGQARFVDGLHRQVAATDAADHVTMLHYDSFLWVWAQDLFEPASMAMPGPNGPHRMRTLLASGYHGIDSNGDGTLTGTESPTAVLYSSLLGPDLAVVSSGVYRPGARPGDENDRAYFLSAGGNIEVLPPDDGNPLGQIVIGNAGDSRPFPELLRLLESQAQPVLSVDTSWLTASHTDEFMNTVPAPTPRGWALVLADPRQAVDVVRSAPPDSTLFGAAQPQRIPSDAGELEAQLAAYFVNQQAPRAVSELVGSPAFADDNERAAVAIDANLALIRDATGLTDDEIIRVPVLYSGDTGGGREARLAGYPRNTLNGLSAGNIYLAPLHHGPTVDGVDILGAATEQSFAEAGIDVAWVDTSPLTPGGELHCATNVLRSLTGRPVWWEHAPR
jgi:protein-arginine deiminase